MLLQLHQEYSDGRTEFIAQTDEFTHGKTPEENQAVLSKWVQDVRKRHPLPDGCKWVIHEQSSPRFVLAAADEEEVCESG